MSIKRKGVGYILLVLLGGALLGSALGQLVGVLLPQGVVRDFFVRAVTPGLTQPVTVDLLVLTLTFGFTLKLNIVALLGVVLAAYLLKWM
ncbi:MAG TPA: DUF4321 domain-containing protein [candidate division Zixibacteria bacterium]|nr:DUF4321 domain-containing protein [candidate division Zixibacteria bacterium]